MDIEERLLALEREYAIQEKEIEKIRKVIGDGEWMKDIKVFGLSGKIGSGKDYVWKNFWLPWLKAQEKQKPIEQRIKRRWMALSLAKMIKQEVIVSESVSYENVFHDKTDQARLKLQSIGNTRREKDGGFVWVRHVLCEMRINREINDVKLFFIPDVRFLEELRIVQVLLQGIVIRIVAPERSAIKISKEAKDDPAMMMKIAQNISETSLDYYADFDGFFQNDESTYEDFEEFAARRKIGV